jgi:Zn-dependent M28 family amino/carboxypeptidase
VALRRSAVLGEVIAVVMVLALAACVGFRPAAAQSPGASITEAGLRGHLYFLSHDLLEGRGTGSRGGAVAAEYIAAQFRRAGLQPVNGSYFQDVPLAGIFTDPDSASLGFVLADARIGADPAADAVVWSGVAEPTAQVSGELVFVGYGIEAPEWEWDDFKGRDLTGRVLLILIGDPPAPPDDPELFDGQALTYYGRWTYKLEEARRRGAAGAILIHHAPSAGYGWNVVASSWAGEQFSLDSPERGQSLPVQAWVTGRLARRVLTEAGFDFDELFVQAARRDFRPVATGVTVQARLQNRVRHFEDRNVVGYLPGRHVARRDELVVFTSHYDHLGVGAPAEDGDSIYNGAYDNASGVSLLLEVAAALAALEDGPNRAILFMATAAEEQGLLGSMHYVRNPLFPLATTVAAINVDGANVWGETDDMLVVGGERSTLGDLVADRAGAMGLVVRPDPGPERGAFFRGDHFPFARAGVPAAAIGHGLRFRSRPDGWGAATVAEYLSQRYHQPSDRYDPGFNLAGALQQARLVLGTLLVIANAQDRPAWHPEGRPERAREAAGRPTSPGGPRR